MTRIDHLMHDAVSHVGADTDRLAAGARRRGVVLRRRRRLGMAGGAVGVAAAVTAVALVVPIVGGDQQAVDPAASPAISDSASPQPGEGSSTGSVKINGRSTAALLRAIVEEQSGGSSTGFGGQGGAPGAGSPDTYGELELTVPSGDTGMVSINVQDVSILGGDSGGCEAGFDDCRTQELPGGDVLRTYTSDDGPRAGALGRVADLISARRGIRLLAHASSDDSAVILTDDQLRALVTDDRWGLRLPAEYDTAGAALEPYEDFHQVGTLDQADEQTEGQTDESGGVQAPVPSPSH